MAPGVPIRNASAGTSQNLDPGEPRAGGMV